MQYARKHWSTDTENFQNTNNVDYSFAGKTLNTQAEVNYQGANENMI